MSFFYPSDPPFVPFPDPVLPPDTNPDAEPLASVCFNGDWLPYILTCIKPLAMEATWKGDDSDAVALACQRGDTLLALFNEAEDGCPASAPFELCISGTFADDDYGFISPDTAPCETVRVDETGFVSCDNESTGHKELHVKRVFTAATYIRSLSFTVAMGLGEGYTTNVQLWLAGIPVYQNLFDTSAGGTVNSDETVNIEADTLTFDIVSDGVDFLTDIVLSNWGMCYTGVFPLYNPGTPGSVIPCSTLINLRLSNGLLTTPSDVPDSLTTPYTPHGGAWESGVGWKATTYSPGISLEVQMDLGGPTTILGHKVRYSANGGFNFAFFTYDGSWHRDEGWTVKSSGSNVLYDHSNFMSRANVTKVAWKAIITVAGYYIRFHEIEASC